MTNTTDLHSKYKTVLLEKLLNEYCSNGQIADELLVYFRDIFTPTIITQYYNQDKYKNVLDYVAGVNIQNWFNEFPQGKLIFKNIEKEINDNRLSFSTFHSIKRLGDLHQSGNTKFLVDKKIYYKSSNNWNNLLSTLIDIVGLPKNYLVEERVEKDIHSRIFLEPNINTKDRKLVEDYYYNLGKILPLLLAIRSNDLILENVICNLPFPVFIDLETIFTPLYTNTDIESDIYDIYKSCFYYRVQNNPRPDFSMLTGGQTTMKSYLVGIISGTEDNPYIKWANDSKGIHYNIPSLDGIKVQPLDYFSRLLQGYKNGVSIVLNNKDAILECISKYEGLFRIILQPTHKYRSVALRYYFPQVYKQNPDIHVFIKQELSKSKHLLSTSPSTYRNIIESEMNQILAGTTPFFSCDMKTTHIYDSKGDTIGNISTPLNKLIKHHFLNLENFLNSQFNV